MGNYLLLIFYQSETAQVVGNSALWIGNSALWIKIDDIIFVNSRKTLIISLKLAS